MKPRISLSVFSDEAGLIQAVSKELSELTRGTADFWSDHLTLFSCCRHAAKLGARVAVIQRHVLDLDFLAEFNTYFSRQFGDCGRYCARIHFFRDDAGSSGEVLDFLNETDLADRYLGFITLRPVGRTPVGATFLIPDDSQGRIRCLDRFPVHLAGVGLSVVGTPFLQQDNAVGACAQASIWMALRTMRKREGDRAFDPAQISGAATRYSVTSRVLPNRSGLTWPQMMDAVRGAGYSPHPVPFVTSPVLGISLTAAQRAEAKRKILAYLDSEIPVLLILYPTTGGHAVVAIGYTFPGTDRRDVESRSLNRGVAIEVAHAASWVQEFIIHNDNSGPYREFPDQAASGIPYALEQAFAAIPLLPVDVFLSGEEAMQIALEYWEGTVEDITAAMSVADTIAFASQFVVRLLLLEKRKVRAWATGSQVPAELAQELRLRDMPRRVWAFEVHRKAEYASHAQTLAQSMVGFFLLDSTADERENAMILSYFNLPILNGSPAGTILVPNGAEWDYVQVPTASLMVPFRPIHQHAAPSGTK